MIYETSVCHKQPNVRLYSVSSYTNVNSVWGRFIICEENGVIGRKEARLVHKPVQRQPGVSPSCTSCNRSVLYIKGKTYAWFHPCTQRNERPKAMLAHYFVYHKRSAAHVAIAIACQPVSSSITISLRADIIEPCDSQPFRVFDIWDKFILCTSPSP